MSSACWAMPYGAGQLVAAPAAAQVGRHERRRPRPAPSRDDAPRAVVGGDPVGGDHDRPVAGPAVGGERAAGDGDVDALGCVGHGAHRTGPVGRPVKARRRTITPGHGPSPPSRCWLPSRRSRRPLPAAATAPSAGLAAGDAAHRAPRRPPSRPPRRRADHRPARAARHARHRPRAPRRRAHRDRRAPAARPRSRDARRSRTVPGALRRALLARRITRAEHDRLRAELRRLARRAAPPARHAARRADRRRAATSRRSPRARRLTAEPLRARLPRRCSATASTGRAARAPPAAGYRVVFGRDPAVFQYYPGQGMQLQQLASWGRVNAKLELACASARAAFGGCAASSPAHGRARRPARRLPGVGVLLLLRRRHAAVDQRHDAGHRRAGARARPRSCSTSRPLGATSPSARWARSRRRRRSASRPRRAAAGTTSCTRSTRACGSSTATCRRSPACATSPTSAAAAPRGVLYRRGERAARARRRPLRHRRLVAVLRGRPRGAARLPPARRPASSTTSAGAPRPRRTAAARERFARYEIEPPRIRLARLRGLHAKRETSVRFGLSKISTVSVRVTGADGFEMTRRCRSRAASTPSPGRRRRAAATACGSRPRAPAARRRRRSASGPASARRAAAAAAEAQERRLSRRRRRGSRRCGRRRRSGGGRRGRARRRRRRTSARSSANASSASPTASAIASSVWKSTSAWSEPASEHAVHLGGRLARGRAAAARISSGSETASQSRSAS